MEIDLLEEIEIGFGPFAGDRIAGVIDARAVGVPGGAAAGGGAVDTRNFVGQRLAGGGVVEEKCAVLGAVFGEGNGDAFAVEGGRIKVYGGRAFGIEFVGIQHDALGGKIVGGFEGDEPGLLGGRLEFQGEEQAGAGLEAGVGRGGLGVNFFQAFDNVGAGRELIKVGAGDGVLGGAPLFDFGIVEVFQPAIIINDSHAVIDIGDRAQGSVRPAGGESGNGGGEQGRHGDEPVGEKVIVHGLSGAPRAGGRRRRRIGVSIKTVHRRPMCHNAPPAATTAAMVV